MIYFCVKFQMGPLYGFRFNNIFCTLVTMATAAILNFFHAQ